MKIFSSGDKDRLKTSYKEGTSFFKSRPLFDKWNDEEIQAKIVELESEIKEGYLSIGKFSQTNSQGNIFDDEKIKNLIGHIDGKEEEIRVLKDYLNKSKNPQKEKSSATEYKLKILKETDSALQRKVRSAIEKCLRRSTFSLRSDAIVFNKVLNDLLDDEIDVKRLAVSELANIGKRETVPILLELLKYPDSQLRAEIINTLVQLDADEIFNVCKSFYKDEYTSIRSACIRGFYKSGRAEAVNFLIEGLQDESVEIRNSSAIFLGWRDDKMALTALLQSASDMDKNVRKSSLSSIANIRDKTSVVPLMRLLLSQDSDFRRDVVEVIEKIIDESIKFNVDGTKKQRSLEIEQMKEWYFKKLHSVEPIETLESEKKSKDSPGSEVYPKESYKDPNENIRLIKPEQTITPMKEKATTIGQKGQRLEDILLAKPTFTEKVDHKKNLSKKKLNSHAT